MKKTNRGLEVIRTKQRFEHQNDRIVFREIRRRLKKQSIRTVIERMINDDKTWGIRMLSKTAKSWKRTYLRYRASLKSGDNRQYRVMRINIGSN